MDTGEQRTSTTGKRDSARSRKKPQPKEVRCDFTLRLTLRPRGDRARTQVVPEKRQGDERLLSDLLRFVRQSWSAWNRAHPGSSVEQQILLAGWVDCPRRRGVPQELTGDVSEAISSVLESLGEGEPNDEAEHGRFHLWRAVLATMSLTSAPGQAQARRPSPATPRRRLKSHETPPAGIAETVEKTTVESAKTAVEEITAASLQTELDAVQAPIVEKLDVWLASLEGTSFEYGDGIEVVNAVKRFTRRTAEQLFYKGELVSIQGTRGTNQRNINFQLRDIDGKPILNSVKFPPVRVSSDS